MITLALDASTYLGSVAVIRDGQVVAARDAEMRGASEERLMPAVAIALTDAGHEVGSVERVVCGAGPGSFTSLRIAASIAKGIAMGVGCPLYAISSLALLAVQHATGPGTWVAASDALRGEWYAGVYEIARDGIREVSAPRVIGPDALAALAAAHGERVVGASIQRGESAGADALIVTTSHRPSASAAASFESRIQDYAVDGHAWEPAYGRLAEAQVKWEAAHGRRLDAR